MSDKLYMRLLIAVLAICVILTLAHMLYAIYAYLHCSIIYFIGGELW